MTDLLPCPFCGYAKPRYVFDCSQGYICCDNCGTQGPCDDHAADPFCDIEAAADAWNRRAPLHPPVGGLVERVMVRLVKSPSDGRTLRGDACVAIQEVAAWLREMEGDYSTIRWLEQEADSAIVAELEEADVHL